jgi:hypothetical protein
MTKLVEITPAVQARLNAAAGTEIDPATVAVFEASAVNTKPLRKRGSIFEGAQISRSTLEDMAAQLNGGESVPLHTLHMQGDELPVGKLIFGEVFDLEDGSSELRVQFYLPRVTRAPLIADIQSAVLDEVSVGIKAKKALCSECGWDFFGPEATFMNLYDRVCANEHEIGKNGVHLNLVGLDRFFELSLVSKGAAQNAKIVSRAKQKLAAGEIEKLAAAGQVPETQIVVASTTQPQPKKDTPMSVDLTALTAQLTDLSAKLALANAAVEQGKTDLAAANAKVTELTNKVAELTAKLEEAGKSDAAAANAKVTELQKIVDDVTAFLADQAGKLLVAAGTKDEAVAEDAAGLIEQIKAKQAALLALVPAGGRSQAADAGTESAQKKSLGAFKVKA